MAAIKTAFKKPSIESQRFLSGGYFHRRSPAFENPDGRTLLNEIDKLFHEDEKSCKKSPNGKESCFSTSKFYPTTKLKRRNTLHSLIPSTEWYKLSPKSKFQRKSKKTAKLYRNKSDTFILHEDICTIIKLPVLCHKPFLSYGTNETLLFSPVERVQRQLFTPDSGYVSSPEHVHRVTARRPKYIIGTLTDSSELDIIDEIFRLVPELMQRILIHLSDKDLVSFAQVSTRWREALILEGRDNNRKLQYLEKKRIAFQSKKENIHRMVHRSRVLTHSSVPFGDIQETSALQRLQPSSSSSRHEQFWQAKKSLRDGEMQMKCLCGSPARINSSKAKATCNNCQSHLCTNCKSHYHGNKPCQTASDISGSGVSTPRSRRNLRRL